MLKCICAYVMPNHSRFCLSERWYPPFWLGPLPLQEELVAHSLDNHIQYSGSNVTRYHTVKFRLQSQHNTNANQRNSFASGIDSSQRPRQKKNPKHCSAYLFFKAVTAQNHTQLKQRVYCTTKMRNILISLKVKTKFP